MNMNNDTSNNNDVERFKKPSIRIMDRLSRPQIQISTLNPLARPTSNSRLGERRNKVKLKPGHSPLDWNYLVTTKGIKGELITGLNDLVQDQMFFDINSNGSLNQLSHHIPTYKIKPPLKINRHILQKHQIWLGEGKDQENDYWCNIGQKVYCLTKYLEFHPGGIDIILGLKDNDMLPTFNRFHRWVSYEKLLETCLVGVFVQE